MNSCMHNQYKKVYREIIVLAYEMYLIIGPISEIGD